MQIILNAIAGLDVNPPMNNIGIKIPKNKSVRNGSGTLSYRLFNRLIISKSFIIVYQVTTHSPIYTYMYMQDKPSTLLWSNLQVLHHT